MRVPRKVTVLDRLEKVGRPRLPVVATPLAGGSEGPEGKEGPAGKDGKDGATGPTGEQGLTGTGTINCRLATAAALPAYTRVGNVYTANANGALPAIDSAAPAVNDFVLLKNGAAGADNGPLKVTSLGSAGSKWTMERIPSMDTSAECVPGMIITVAEGTLYADTTWQLTTNGTITLNTTALAFAPVARAVAPACRVYKATGQSINNITLTALTFDNERFDNDGMHSTSSNTSRITFTKPGVYVVSGSVAWDSANSKNVWLGIRLNGVSSSSYLAAQWTPAGFSAEATVSTIYKFAAGDYIELMVYQQHGSALSTLAAANLPFPQEFSAAYVGEG